MIKNNAVALIMVLLASFIDVSTAAATVENTSNGNGSITGFSKIYSDGFGVNSGGFKLILRTYERRMETSYQPFLADIEYILLTQEEGEVIYSKRIEQVPLSMGSEGMISLSHQFNVVLEESKNYTGIAKVYLYTAGNPEYYLTVVSNFTARSDADITEVYGDGIGASATIKSKSMVPLTAKVVFTLKQAGRIIETREITAPSIMSNDKEKTVNIIWTSSLNEGTYLVSVVLQGRYLTVNYDKIFTVEKKALNSTPKPTAQSGHNSHSIPGFTSISAVLAILILVLIPMRRS
ncbi:MAG: hypothetical protein WA130_10800 [Candidatus Methanoperedens sp.]